MTVFQHPYYQLNLKEGILHFFWNELHSEMNYPDFKEACSNYAGFTFQHKIEKLLIDTRNFAFSIPPEYGSWREEVHHPRLSQAGVKKMAFLMPRESMQYVQDEEAEDGKFAISYFESPADAEQWLAS